MSNYTDFLARAISKKVVLVEIDEITSIGNDNLWIKDTADIWKLTYSWVSESRTYVFGSGAWGYGDYGSTSTGLLPEPIREPIVRVNSLVVDGEDWLALDAYSDLSSYEESFYWDTDNQILYINAGTSVISPNDLNIKIGITQGFANITGYYGGLYYEGRVSSFPSLEASRDVDFFGKISFQGGQIVLVNTDGYFDILQNRGQIVKIFFGGDELEYSEYEQVYEGYVEEIENSAITTKIKMQDSRKLLEKSIPVNVFNDTYYPSIEPDQEDSPIPIAYGIIRNAKAIPIDTSATFKVCDTEFNSITSIQAVYIEGYGLASHGSVSTANGTFVVTDAYYDDADHRDLVTVSFTANTINKPLDVIKDLLVNYTDVLYNDTFFNTDEWDTYNSTIISPVSVYVGENKDLIKVIEEICYSAPGLLVIQGDGRISFKQKDLDATSVKDVLISELVKISSVKYDQKNYASTVRVGYFKDITNNEYRYVNDDSREEELSIEYRKSNIKEVETVFQTSTQAAILAADFLEYYGGFFPVFTFTTKTQNMDIRIEDNVNLMTYPNDDGTYNSVKLEIIGIKTNFNDFTMTFTGRYIETNSGDFNLTQLLRWVPPKTY